jgi:DNA-binding NtrC family response regulator
MDILIIDDNQDHLAGMMAALKEEKYSVIACDDPVDAFDCFCKIRETLSLVFLDYRMQRISGDRLLALFQKHGPRVPVVMMTGYQSESLFQRFRDQGAAACLEKPFDLEELFSACRAHQRQDRADDASSSNRKATSDESARWRVFGTAAAPASRA